MASKKKTRKKPTPQDQAPEAPVQTPAPDQPAEQSAEPAPADQATAEQPATTAPSREEVTDGTTRSDLRGLAQPAAAARPPLGRTRLHAGMQSGSLRVRCMVPPGAFGRGHHRQRAVACPAQGAADAGACR